MLEEIMQIPWGRMMILMLGLYVFFILLALVYSSKAMFPVPRVSYQKSPWIDFLQTPSGLKIAFSRRGEIDKPKMTIIYSHGNGEDIGRLESLFDKWKDQDWELIVYDYPGYGLSSGKPTEKGCYEAIDEVYSFVVDELKRSPGSILVWGRSLGTGPSCYLASKEKVAGILLETPFLSAFRTVTEIPFLPWDHFNNLARISSIKCPSLVIHGKRDEIVPFRHGKRIHELLPSPKEFLKLDEASHNDIESVGGKKYNGVIKEFIENLASH